MTMLGRSAIKLLKLVNKFATKTLLRPLQKASYAYDKHLYVHYEKDMLNAIRKGRSEKRIKFETASFFKHKRNMVLMRQELRRVL